MLAHEMRHALGYCGGNGDELLEMLNVRKNENPVAIELGEPERIKCANSGTLCPKWNILDMMQEFG